MAALLNSLSFAFTNSFLRSALIADVPFVINIDPPDGAVYTYLIFDILSRI